MKKQTLLLLGVVVASAVAGAWLASAMRPAREAPEPLQFGTLLPEPQPLPPFALIDQSGAPIDVTALQGRWSLMFFGFTHCPEVCPTTLTLLVDVANRMGEQRPQVVLVSVDPQRDTPEVTARYVSAFDPAMLGITGSPDSIEQFARAMGIAHRKVPMSGDEYMVDHTAAVFVIDPQGRRRAIFSPPLDAAQIAADLQRLTNAPGAAAAATDTPS